MKIAVCVKQVPDRESRFQIDPETNHIKYEGLKFDTNDFDRYAVEAALQLKDAVGGEVTVVTVGPDRAKEVLTKGLAMGADQAVHVSDERISGSDAHAVSKILEKVFADRPHDVVFCGVQSEDQGYAQTGILLAERLGFAHATVVVSLEAKDDGTLFVKRELEGGDLAPVTLPTPTVLTIQTGINQPRYPKLMEIMRAKKKPYEKLTLDDLGIDPGSVGESGRRTEVLDLFLPEEKGAAEIFSGSVDEQVEALVGVLKDINVL